MGFISAAKAVQKFYAAPMQSKSSSKAICIFVFAIIVAVAIVIAYRHKGANKLFMKDGLIGRQFHNNAAWKAIVVSVASGLAVLGLTYTFIATGYHIKHKKKTAESGKSAELGNQKPSPRFKRVKGLHNKHKKRTVESGKPELSNISQVKGESGRIHTMRMHNGCETLFETHDTENNPLPEDYELRDNSGNRLPPGWFRIYNGNNYYFYHPQRNQSVWNQQEIR